MLEKRRKVMKEEEEDETEGTKRQKRHQSGVFLKTKMGFKKEQGEDTHTKKTSTNQERTETRPNICRRSGDSVHHRSWL